MMNKTAFLFPGQGSQSVGMGEEFYQEYDVVREIFDMAEETAKMSISKLCFKGPMEELTQTVNLQPAVTTVNLSCLAVLKKEGISCDFCAGHSLGEYSALNAAGIVSGEDTIRLVHKRGELMHRESTKNKGAMHAIVGLPFAEVDSVSADIVSIVIANENLVFLRPDGTASQRPRRMQPEIAGNAFLAPDLESALSHGAGREAQQ